MPDYRIKSSRYTNQGPSGDTQHRALVTKKDLLVQAFLEDRTLHQRSWCPPAQLKVFNPSLHPDDAFRGGSRRTPPERGEQF